MAEIQNQTDMYDTIKSKFKNGLRWNFSGSMIYETIKTFHQLFLIKFLSVSLYGLIGSTLSLIYLATKIADVGTTYSLPPFFHLFTKNKFNFKKLFFKYFLLPQLPIIIITAIATTYIYRQNFVPHAQLLLIVPIIIILETFRSFLRYFLNFSFKTKTVVILEVSTFLTYVSFIWFCVLYKHSPVTLKLILLTHVTESAIVVSVFSGLVYSMYKKLPDTENVLDSTIWRRLLNMRLFNYLIRLSKDLFTSNFLTPFFAFRFGFEQAGFFFFATNIASSIQSIFKQSVGFSGHALFANLKESSQAEKKEAFDLLCQKLVHFVAPPIIFLLINYKFIIKLGNTQDPTLLTGALVLMFLTIILTEFFLLLYEQFYIIEEATQKLFFFKIFELALLYLVVMSKASSSPLIMLINITFIRLISFVIIAINAYYLWKIKPRLKPEAKFLTLCVIISILFSLLSS
ncbi:MAG: hypothetical protein ABH827_02320 [bacterium]